MRAAHANLGIDVSGHRQTTQRPDVIIARRRARASACDYWLGRTHEQHQACENLLERVDLAQLPVDRARRHEAPQPSDEFSL